MGIQKIADTQIMLPASVLAITVATLPANSPDEIMRELYPRNRFNLNRDDLGRAFAKAQDHRQAANVGAPMHCAIFCKPGSHMHKVVVLLLLSALFLLQNPSHTSPAIRFEDVSIKYGLTASH